MSDTNISRLRKRQFEPAGAMVLGRKVRSISLIARRSLTPPRIRPTPSNICLTETGVPERRDGLVGPDVTEQIVLEFDKPQTISRLVYEVEETMRERTQEVRVEVSEDEGRTYRQVLVQQYTFSPAGATYQREEQRLNLRQISHLRLRIVPNKSGSGTATLTALRLFA